jgi:DNA-binding NtrC family response regulator
MDPSESNSDQRLNLLVIDDDDLVVGALRMAIPPQWRLTHFSDQNKAKNLPLEGCVAALVDMHLTNDLAKAEGVAVIEKLHKANVHLEIIAMSGDLNRELMEACLKAGASRFLPKPLNTEELSLTLDKIEAHYLLRSASTRSSTSRLQLQQLQWIGSSNAAQTVRRQIAQLRRESGPILIEGESGTGKEVAASLIHAQESSRPFVSVNVAALPDSVFESEFFGHVRGAFTGADQNKMGLAEAAHGGDLFLDEIEALPLNQQAKLLRFLESGEIRRVGAKDSIRVQTRVIAATNQNLESMVRDGKFREDLLWRLNGKKITLPPLRHHPEDIAELTTYFLANEKPRRNKSLDPDALETLKLHQWAGNVRELKRVCEQLSLNSPLPIIRRADVIDYLPRVSRPDSNFDLSLGLTEIVARIESEVIRATLQQTAGVDEAALKLKISRSSLYKKIKDYDIELRG